MSDGERSLHQQVSDLERLKSELEQAITSQRAEVERYRERLRLLEAGVFGKRRWPLVLLILLVIVGGVAYGGASYYLGRRQARTKQLRRVINRPLVPHLLVTSVPDHAAVLLDGIRAGHTPLMRDLKPLQSRVAIEVMAAGYPTMKKTLAVGPTSGAHWHAVLGPPPGAGSQEMRRPSKIPKQAR